MSGRIRVAPKAARTCNGIVFASKAEMIRYIELCVLERAGRISFLETQPVFELLPDFVYQGKKYKGIRYIADFRYLDAHGVEWVEDVKGVQTDAYKLKKKMLLAKYPEINFLEVRR